MSWRGNFSTSTRQNRMKTLLGRVEAVRLPPMDEVCNKYVTSAEDTSALVRDLEDRVFFSTFREDDVSLSFSTFAMNSSNLEDMKRSGSLGVVIEMLRRLPKDVDPRSNHVVDIVRCLYIMSEDVSLQNKILSNIYALPCILQLCAASTGELQCQLVQIVDRLSKTKNGISELIDNNFFEYFLSKEMLFRPSTLVSVRHVSASIINRIAAIAPQHFLLFKFQSVCFDGLNRHVDGTIETMLLEAVLSHLTWLAGEEKQLGEICTAMSYFIEEVRKEAFEDVNHLHQILRCIYLLSREQKQIKYMLKNGLGLILQYIVKTDFELWRKPIMTVKRGTRHSGTSASKSSSHILLDAIRAVPMRASKLEEVNYRSTRYAVQIYENIMEHDLSEISEIVTSGLISGMLFRVGRGQHIDPRFNRLVVHFVREILMLVSISQNHESMALDGGSHDATLAGKHHRGKKRKFQRGDEVTKALQEGNLIEVSTLTVAEQKMDLRSVSTTLHGQGVTKLFLQCILSADDVELVSGAMTGLSLLHFPCIVGDICSENAMGKICFYCLTRYDSFFPGLSLVCEVIYYTTDICRAAGVGIAAPAKADSAELEESNYEQNGISDSVAEARVLIDSFIVDFNVITVLVKAMMLSGWVFHMKVKRNVLLILL
jgi:hypothetical protein